MRLMNNIYTLTDAVILTMDDNQPLIKTGRIIGIKVIDHIIIAGDKYLSFKEKNLF